MLVVLVLLIFLEGCNSSGRGCKDPLANNLEVEAAENDGGYTYDEVWIRPRKSLALSESLKGTSGLLFWEGSLWTHNDNADTRLYELDTSSGAIREDYLLEGVENTNWEDMDQDSEFIYLGDFGNNASGNRDDLHILRIQKASLLSGSPDIDTIWFSYSDQHDLNPVGPNQTEFDCEAFVLSSGHIFLFTKQWITGHTSVYALPKQPGNHVAQKLNSFDIQGLVSGATFLESKQLLVLCGYSGILQPFLYLMYDFPAYDFFSGNKRRVNISIPFLQVEGIASMDGLTYYLSNESYVKEPVTNTLQQLHILELNSYLEE
ncbi:MAG: T9SS C-terminal target domain-containing protein [Bacteroidia bacterium]|nr:MAG: T9SS C-terminal target domain-containing protein [Bacteroidia bacterium]